nr:MAG TPA: hypothetical protein [Caudoviricetes sp.]
MSTGAVNHLPTPQTIRKEMIVCIVIHQKNVCL